MAACTALPSPLTEPTSGFRLKCPSSGKRKSSAVSMSDEPSSTPMKPCMTSASLDPSFEGASASLLLSLPRELRDRIYYHALVSDRPICWPAPLVKRNIAHGLLAACRQIYTEAAPILYSANEFLFSHPSDCTMFRVVASPQYSSNITRAYIRIRPKDIRLWASYLGSRRPERCLKNDLPCLKTLWIYLSETYHDALQNNPEANARAMAPVLLRRLIECHVEVVKLQDIVKNRGGAMGLRPEDEVPLPSLGPTFTQLLFSEAHQLTAPRPVTHYFPPPAQRSQQHFHHRHGAIDLFLTRWERETGLESLCLSLQETKPTDTEVKAVCLFRLAPTEMSSLYHLFSNDLIVQPNGNLRTRFRKLLGLKVAIEIAGSHSDREPQRFIDALMGRLTQGIASGN